VALGRRSWRHPKDHGAWQPERQRSEQRIEHCSCLRMAAPRSKPSMSLIRLNQIQEPSKTANVREFRSIQPPRKRWIQVGGVAACTAAMDARYRPTFCKFECLLLAISCSSASVPSACVHWFVSQWPSGLLSSALVPYCSHCVGGLAANRLLLVTRRSALARFSSRPCVRILAHVVSLCMRSNQARANACGRGGEGPKQQANKCNTALPLQAIVAQASRAIVIAGR
jgi:hypothetical protein